MQSHGCHGPLSVSPIQGPQPVGQYVIDAFVAAGIPLNEDYCDGSQSGVYRSEEHTSELQSLMRISYAVFCLQTKSTLPTGQEYTAHKVTTQATHSETHYH